MDFEWNEAKSEETRERRGFGFEVVFDFDWDNARITEDRRFDYGETRYWAIGYAGMRRLFVTFTLRGDVKRIISVRAMHEKEARRYGL